MYHCTRLATDRPRGEIDISRGRADNSRMCRSIKKLRNTEVPATPEEIQAAALQFVRKVSGYRVPAKKNEQAFADAVEAVTLATATLLQQMDHPAQAK